MGLALGSVVKAKAPLRPLLSFGHADIERRSGTLLRADEQFTEDFPHSMGSAILN